jgi:hypothetical protein
MTTQQARPCQCRCLACAEAAPHENARQHAVCCFVAGRDEPPPPAAHPPTAAADATPSIHGLPSSLPLDVAAAAARATAALAPQHSTRARQLAASHAAELAPLLVHASGREEALTNRLASASEAAIGADVEEDEARTPSSKLEEAIAARLSLLHLGTALMRVGDERRVRHRLRLRERRARRSHTATIGMDDACVSPSVSCPNPNHRHG